LTGVFERFTDEARRAVVLAQEECRDLRHGRIGPEHLVLGVAAVPAGNGAKALADAGADLPGLRRALLSAVPRGASAPAGHLPFSPEAKKVMERSLHEAQRRDSAGISSGHLLLAALAGADPGVRAMLAGVDGVALKAAAEARIGDEGPHGTPAPPDRLDRIEAALADVTARLDRIERLLGGGESAAQG
jgi:ATP-dependent Clp protease ATP-binding subunit ClpA